MNVNSTVLQNMTPIKRRCFPLFSFMQFIAWLIPWPWACDSWIYSQAPRETSSRGKPTILEAQTGESLLVSDNDLKYLTREEAEQIIERFKGIPQSFNRLVFWTGIPREWVQRWADDHGMLTLTSAMGPLMDRKDQRCLRRIKKPRRWSKYIKGASVIFARYACRRGIVRVLTLPPSWAEFIRPRSTYRTLEEPILKGASGCCCAVEIHTVHLLTTLEELEYQTWPENRIPDRLNCRGVGSFSFRLPPWTRKAVDTAAKSLRYNVINLTASTTPKPATVSVVLQGSVKVAGEPPTAKQPRGGKELSNTNDQDIIQSKSSQPRKHEQQPQSQQPLSKKKKKKKKKQQQQTQLSQGKNQQLQSHQPQSKEKQSQTQQSPSKNKQSQIQLSQSKNQKPLSQQTQNKKQRPQSPQTSSKKKQPQAQESSSKKKQPKPQQSSSKKEQLQKQQTQKHQTQNQQP
jgi:hypothetical protein